MSSNNAAVASFIEASPPARRCSRRYRYDANANLIDSDLKSLTFGQPELLASQEPAFANYNETQFAIAKLPDTGVPVLVSSLNRLSDGRYYDTAASVSFDFDHTTEKATNVRAHPFEARKGELVKSLIKSFNSYAAEHYPASTVGVFVPTDSEIALLLVANKNGRWRSQYTVDVDSGTIKGFVKVDVHYYEDGNVRLETEKKMSNLKSPSPTSADIIKAIGQAEKQLHQDLNRAFSTLSDGAFKLLRRQLPVTRQKVEWDKIGGYRLGQDIGGGRSK